MDALVSNRLPSRAYFLVGPTAVGKTVVAHELARRGHMAILSADSMMVYRGMSTGTAKPTPKEREGIPYAGIDLVPPSEDFSAADYLVSVVNDIKRIAEQGYDFIVTGGSGLYVQCLMHGLDRLPKADPELRGQAATLLREGGITALKSHVQSTFPSHYAALKDKENPRRLIRAWELGSQGVAPPSRALEDTKPTVIGLKMAAALLYERIEQRVDTMYAEGLLDEVKKLRTNYKALSATALQAIGYREAMGVLDGTLELDAAKRTTATRTRQLAKRQMTWFRNQHEVSWIDVEPGMTCGEIADLVSAKWRTYGPTPLCNG